MKVKALYNNPYREASYILSDADGQAVLIDAGYYTDKEKQRFKDYVEKEGLHLTAVLLTHAHLDHILGLRFIFDNYGLIPYLNPADNEYFMRQQEQEISFGCPLVDKPITEYKSLSDNEILHFGSIELQVIFTPGHTEGGTCFYAPHEGLLFSGDTLFAGSVGRSDLYGGDYNKLMNSIRKLMSLPPQTEIYAGHGLTSTIEYELQTNPYCRL